MWVKGLKILWLVFIDYFVDSSSMTSTSGFTGENAVNSNLHINFSNSVCKNVTNLRRSTVFAEVTPNWILINNTEEYKIKLMLCTVIAVCNYGL